MQKPDAGTRLGAMLLDHIAMTMLATMVCVPFYFYSITRIISTEKFQLYHTGMYFMIIGFALYFCKDSINGRSLAKRGLNLQVVNNETGIAASPYRCLVRNLFAVIWPIECIMVLANPSRRIGDMVAGTKVIVFDKSVEQPKVDYTNVFASLVISYVIFLPFVFLMSIVQKEIDTINYDFPSNIETYNYEPNDAFTYDLLTAVDDSLGDLIIPKGNVYDSRTPNHKKLELLIWVKKWSLDDSTSVETIHNNVLSIIKNEYPQTKFKGNIEYQYKEDVDAPLSKITYSVSITYNEEEFIDDIEELDTIQ